MYQHFFEVPKWLNSDKNKKEHHDLKIWNFQTQNCNDYRQSF